jgi:hypothetical protein
LSRTPRIIRRTDEGVNPAFEEAIAVTGINTTEWTLSAPHSLLVDRIAIRPIIEKENDYLARPGGVTCGNGWQEA